MSPKRPAEPRCVFVTVGTTKFDELIARMLSAEVLTLLASLGYTRLTLQVGHGTTPVVPGSAPISVEWYRFKDSLEADMHAAALMVSHAGAGSILEGLRLRAKLMVVTNERLMDNHQQELADEMHARRHLIATTVGGLLEALRTWPELSRELTPYPDADRSLFPRFLTEQLGLGE